MLKSSLLDFELGSCPVLLTENFRSSVGVCAYTWSRSRLYLAVSEPATLRPHVSRRRTSTSEGTSSEVSSRSHLAAFPMTRLSNKSCSHWKLVFCARSLRFG